MEALGGGEVQAATHAGVRGVGWRRGQAMEAEEEGEETRAAMCRERGMQQLAAA